MEPHFFIHFCIHFVRNKLTNFFYSTFSNLKFKTLGRVFTILNLKKKGGGGVLCLHIHLLKSKSRVADCQFQHDKRFSLTFWKFFFFTITLNLFIQPTICVKLTTLNLSIRWAVKRIASVVYACFKPFLKSLFNFFILIHRNTKKSIVGFKDLTIYFKFTQFVVSILWVVRW